jgi:hypothetical protein
LPEGQILVKEITSVVIPERYYIFSSDMHCVFSIKKAGR